MSINSRSLSLCVLMTLVLKQGFSFSIADSPCPSYVYYPKVNLLYKLILSKWVFCHLVYLVALCKHVLLISVISSSYPTLWFLPVPSATLTLTTQCKGKVYWCHSPSYGSHSLLHNDSIMPYVFFFLINSRILIASYQPCLEISYYLYYLLR